MNRHHQPFAVQLLDLTLIQLANWRWSWRSMLLTAVVAPLLRIAGLGVFANAARPARLAYILTGNMVMSLLFGTFDKRGGALRLYAHRRAAGFFRHAADLPRDADRWRRCSPSWCWRCPPCC